MRLCSLGALPRPLVFDDGEGFGSRVTRLWCVCLPLVGDLTAHDRGLHLSWKLDTQERGVLALADQGLGADGPHGVEVDQAKVGHSAYFDASTGSKDTITQYARRLTGDPRDGVNNGCSAFLGPFQGEG